MLAIPSPDVLMNLFASAAQVLGLLFLCVGGGLFTRRRLPGARAQAQASRWPFALVTLGLVAVSVSFLLYHLAVVDAEQRRLRTNLVRSSQEAGKKVGDTSLKTLAYSDQEKQPRGITTEQLQTWLAEGRPLNLIDVRETEEVEMGRIHGTWARRYPDLQADRTDLIVPGKETILLCESGNRSSELEEFFFKEGITTKFMVGGYEKWVAEDRAMDGLGSADRDDLRAIPDFPNKRTLLTTEEAAQMFEQENALFVDVRYPGDFELAHLPGAVNITLRKMTTEQANAALAALPKRPIIAPCYDKRSSFYALILGVRLSRMGYDFRGRYTVPHEWAAPAKDSPWVAAWNEANAERTLFGSARNTAQATVGWLDKRLGGLALAIVAAALLLRLLLLPFAVKAERDTIVQRRLAQPLRDLRTRLAADPARLQRATMGLLRAHRIRPFANLATSLVVLLSFTLLFAAIERACAGSTARLGWFALSDADPLAILPLTATALLAAIVALTAGRRRTALVIGFLFVAGVTPLLLSLRAGVQLYLVVSFAALLLQNALVRWRLRTPRAPRIETGAAVVPLALAKDRDDLGGKAQRLGAMLHAGFVVPDGFVVAPDAAADHPAIAAAFARLGADTVAVRSSACGEDGAQQSFAGEFRTELGVARQDLAAAIAKVRASYRGRSGGVIVQRMVPAEFAGVLFTEDPAHAGRALVEMIDGLGEDLVSGKKQPTEHRFGRVTSAAVAGSPAARIDLQPLLALGRRLEAAFGCPQDVEWAFAQGSFVLLQSRAITRRPGDGDGPVAVREGERARLLAAVAGAPASEPVFACGDYAALLPAPSPYSLALMQAIWAPGGSVDLAARRLGLRFTGSEDAPPFVRSVFGRCCVDLRGGDRVQATAVAGFRLGMLAPALERDFTERFAPTATREARLHDALDLARLDLAELHDLHRTTRAAFLQSTYVEAEVVNLAAEAYFAAARRRLERRGLDAAALLGQGVTTVVQRSLALLAGQDREAAKAAFLAAFGHRAQHDFELAEPRFREAADLVATMAIGQGAAVAPTPTELPHGRLLRAEVQRARRFQELKEEAKHVAMRELAFLRAVLRELGARHGLGDDVFWLQPDEIDRLVEPAFATAAGALAARRRRDLDWLRAVPLPDTATPADLEHLGEQRALPALPPTGLRGIRVAGDHDAEGRVRVLRSPNELTRLKQGEILVVRCTDPCWMAAFRIAGGLVSEVGGWLSHAAIQAREHNLPTIVGLAEATERLRDGDLVRLHRDGTVECVSAAAVGAAMPSTGRG